MRQVHWTLIVILFLASCADETRTQALGDQNIDGKDSRNETIQHGEKCGLTISGLEKVGKNGWRVTIKNAGSKVAVFPKFGSWFLVEIDQGGWDGRSQISNSPRSSGKDDKWMYIEPGNEGTFNLSESISDSHDPPIPYTIGAQLDYSAVSGPRSAVLIQGYIMAESGAWAVVQLGSRLSP
jgi:hypothetical protein